MRASSWKEKRSQENGQGSSQKTGRYMGHDDRAREPCRRDGAHKVSWEGVKEPDDPALQSMLCKYFLDH